MMNKPAIPGLYRVKSPSPRHISLESRLLVDSTPGGYFISSNAMSGRGDSSTLDGDKTATAARDSDADYEKQESPSHRHDPHHYHPRPDQDVESGLHMSGAETDEDEDEDEDWDCQDPNEKDHHDGHRPCALETRPTWSRTRSRRDSRGSASGLSLNHTISRRETVLSRLRSRAVPQFTHPLTNQRTTPADLVDFDGLDDPYRPLNWTTHKKITTTLLYGLVTMSATWASSAYSAGTSQIAEQFQVGTEVATLGTTVFLLGFGLGPLLWAPLSEVYGRRIAVLTPMFVAICFSFATATAKDLQTIMITRFFGAFFAAAPVTNTGGVLGDVRPCPVPVTFLPASFRLDDG